MPLIIAKVVTYLNLKYLQLVIRYDMLSVKVYQPDKFHLYFVRMFIRCAKKVFVLTFCSYSYF